MYQISYRSFQSLFLSLLAFFWLFLMFFWPILFLLWLMLLLYDGRWRIELRWLHQFFIKIGIFNLDFLTTKHQMLKIKIHNIKVEKILKGSLDSISSPLHSVKIQIVGRKVCLRRKGKYCWALSTNCSIQKFVDNIQQLFAFTPFSHII